MVSCPRGHKPRIVLLSGQQRVDLVEDRYCSLRLRSGDASTGPLLVDHGDVGADLAEHLPLAHVVDDQ